MKIIEIPPDVAVKVSDGPPVAIRFKDWIQNCLDAYEPLGRGLKQQRQAAKLASMIEQANGTLALEDADFDVVKAARENPPYRPVVSRQVTVFQDAIDKAEEVNLQR